MSVFDRYQKDDKKSGKPTGRELGTTVMRYLYLESPKGVEDKERLKKRKQAGKHRESPKFSSDSPFFRWARPLDSARPAFPSQTSEGQEHPTRLLNKFATGDNILTMPISEIDNRIRKYTKSPLVIDGIAGALTGAGYWAFDRFVNPPNTPKLQRKAEKLYVEDGGRLPFEHYLELANEKDKKRRLLYSAAVGLGGAGLAATLQYNPAYKDSWRKFVPKYGVTKTASMFGPPSHVSVNAVRGAIMANPSLPQSTKNEIMGMLAGLPNRPLTSTDIINAAVRSGASARSGKPLGRIAVAAVADAATAYAAGNAFGVGSPGRLAALAGIGSAAYRYMV
jgi:hypothetical protein